MCSIYTTRLFVQLLKYEARQIVQIIYIYIILAPPPQLRYRNFKHIRYSFMPTFIDLIVKRSSEFITIKSNKHESINLTRCGMVSYRMLL